jgi:hypothetical protein
MPINDDDAFGKSFKSLLNPQVNVGPALPRVGNMSINPEILDAVNEAVEKKANPAGWAYERLKSQLLDFQSSLDDEHEVGIAFVSHGDSEKYFVRSFGCSNPDLLVFHCLAPNGKRADIIQHYTQVNLLLLAIPKADPSAPAKRIGFV